MSSAAVHHISPTSPPFEVGSLSPIQVQVVAALDTLRQLLTSPDTPPAQRLQAALAVLERPGHRDPGWQVPLPCQVGDILYASVQ